MNNILKTLRPVGNRISPLRQEFDNGVFIPFKCQFYQSGTASLAAAIIASNRLKSTSNRPEVIIPAYGCPDLVSAIVFAGATPVLVDIEPGFPWMSLESILEAITPNTTALVAVNFLGIQERMDKLRTICRKNRIILIEDSAQGFPINDHDRYWHGDFNIVSFGRGKPVNLLSGGAVLCRDDSLLTLLPTPTEARQSIFARPKYWTKLAIYNISINPFIYNFIYRIPGLNIGKTIYKPLAGIFDMPEQTLKLLTDNINRYCRIAKHNNSIVNILSHTTFNQAINIVPHIKHNHDKPLLRYPLLIKNKQLRDILYYNLKPYGASLMYQKPLNQIENIPQELFSSNIDYLNAVVFSNSLITLPLHNAISDKDVQSILSILEKYLK